MNLPKKKDKKSQTQKKSLPKLRIRRPALTIRSRNGLFSTSMTAIAVAAVILFNIAVGCLPASVKQLDLSSTKIYDISETTKNLLNDMTEDVTLTAVATESSTDNRIVTFLKRYAALSDHLTLKWVDPVTTPSALTQYSCEANTLVVSCQATGETRNVLFDDILVLDQYSYYYYGEETYTEFDGEGQLASAIDGVLSNVSHLIYTTENHGEADLSQSLTDSLSKSHFTTQTVSLLQTGSVPEDCDLLMISSPQKDFTAEEVTMIEDYLAKGGKVNLTIGDMSFDHPNLDKLLQEYGMTLSQSYVGDSSRYYPAAQSYFAFFPVLDTASSAADNVTDDALVLLVSTYGLTVSDPARDTITTKAFLTTDKGLTMDAEQNAVDGDFALGVTATETLDDDKTASFTVCSDSLTADSINQQFGDAVANLTVFMNTVTNGFDDVSNISIESKSLETPTNTISGGGLWSMLFVAVLPLTVLGLGGYRWWKRRKL